MWDGADLLPFFSVFKGIDIFFSLFTHVGSHSPTSTLLRQSCPPAVQRQRHPARFGSCRSMREVAAAATGTRSLA